VFTVIFTGPLEGCAAFCGPVAGARASRPRDSTVASKILAHPLAKEP